MKTRGQLLGVIDEIDARMNVAANTVVNHLDHWQAWQQACGATPSIDQVPDDLKQWWQGQMLDAGKRAFGHEDLRRRSLGREYDDGISGRSRESSIPYIASTYRGFSIAVDLTWSRLLASWSTTLTIALEQTGGMVGRWGFDGIPITVAGADGACNILVEIAKRRIDRVLLLAFGRVGA